MAADPRYNENLVPPIGTCYYKSYTYSLPRAIDHPIAAIDVTFHIYVTAVKPTDPNFAAKGGKVYIIAVYNGTASPYIRVTVGGITITIPCDFNFGVEDLSATLSHVDRQPTPASEETIGDMRRYTISFARTMSMFNNGGNTGFSFPAKYERIFSLTGLSQSKHQLTGWTINRVDSEKRDDLPVTYGLQVFETNRLTIAKCKFYCKFYGFADKLFTKEFDLDFSANTMAKAVVGG